MLSGRTPSWNVIADIEPTTWLEPVQFASDDRLLLPSTLRKRVPWSHPKATLGLLATICADGAVAVLPMSDRKAELAALREVFESSDDDERADLAYAAMATYHRISLQPDGRMRLSPSLVLHLCPDEQRRVWVGAHGGAITLWSERDWAVNLARTSTALREALEAAQTSA